MFFPFQLLTFSHGDLDVGLHLRLGRVPYYLQVGFGILLWSGKVFEGFLRCFGLKTFFFPERISSSVWLVR